MISKAKQHIVPAILQRPQGQLRQVGMLIGQQSSYQSAVEGEFGSGVPAAGAFMLASHSYRANTSGYSIAPNVKDVVGYGATANVETLAAPGLTNTTANARIESRTDTDNNSIDFTAEVPKVTNSAGTTWAGASAGKR